MNTNGIRMTSKKVLLVWACAIASLLSPVVSHAERLKDLVSFQGVRDNQLIGYGIVVGLAGIFCLVGASACQRRHSSACTA